MSQPTISIIVPNYNYGHTIGRTIESLLDQKYPALEVIVYDGGSTDNSVEVIRRYEKHLKYWVSEKDRGQSDAINKGFAHATGDVVNWLCSDDYLLPGALARVGEVFAAEPVDVVAGRTRKVFEGGERREAVVEGPTLDAVMRMPYGCPVEQPSCFFRRGLLRERPVRDDLNFAMDLELWCYLLARGARWKVIDDVLSVYRFYDTNKTTVAGTRAWREWMSIHREYRGGDAVLRVITDGVRRPLIRSASDGGDGLKARVCWTLDNGVARVLRGMFGGRADTLGSFLYMFLRQDRENERRGGVAGA